MQTNIMDLFSFHEKITKNSFERIESQKGFAEVKDLTTKVYDQSQDDLKIFFDIVKGLRWNDYPNMQIMCLPQRFLGVDSIGILDINKVSLIDEIVRNCFYLGLVYHFIYTNFSTRQNIDAVDFEDLVNEWLNETLISSLRMRGYNKDQSNMPELYYKVFYEKEKEYDMIWKTEFNLGFWKRSKVYSFLKNIFYSGLMFGLRYDLKTKDG